MEPPQLQLGSVIEARVEVATLSGKYRRRDALLQSERIEKITMNSELTNSRPILLRILTFSRTSTITGHTVVT